MASTLAPTITPDTVMSFDITPGTLYQFLASRAEGGPRLKCFEGSVTLVSPSKPHESMGHRLDRLIVVVCLELGIKHLALGSTTWALPFGAGDTAYEPDEAYYVQSHATAKPRQPPDLAIEIVVSHSENKAMCAGAFLKIPEMWVLDLQKHRLTFYHLAVRGKSKGSYRPEPRSRAFPVLISAEVLERLDDSATDDTAFLRNCQDWVRRVLVPRLRAENGGA
jgi:Uma2 family endonuclease